MLTREAKCAEFPIELLLSKCSFITPMGSIRRRPTDVLIGRVTGYYGDRFIDPMPPAKCAKK